MPTRPCLGGIYQQEALHIFFLHQVCLLKKSSLTILYHRGQKLKKFAYISQGYEGSSDLNLHPAVSVCPFYSISLGDQSAVSVDQSPPLSKTLLFSSNEEFPKGVLQSSDAPKVENTVPVWCERNF